jgi:uncharacterized protein
MGMGDLDARLVFHDGLKDFLAASNEAASPGPIEISYPVTRRASVKDVIEALGPPHTEVGSILVDGEDTGFHHILEPGQEVHVHPIPHPFDVLSPTPLRPDPLHRIAFAVDANVGKLARLLRLLGFDATADRGWNDSDLADIADTTTGEGRIVLSKDRGLLKRSKIVFARYIRAIHPEDQLIEVLSFFALAPPYKPFSRCLLCNEPLTPIAKATILHRLEPLTIKYFHTFHTCPSCNRIYWPGSHHDRLLERLERMKNESRVEPPF